MALDGSPAPIVDRLLGERCGEDKQGRWAMKVAIEQ
jgi:hypothetical protein